MGCFDYECECGGTTCAFVGGQIGGDSEVVIEVPLDDGTNVYMKGSYESYGSVHVGQYEFYLEQFSDFFSGWLSSHSEVKRKKIFLAKRIWTMRYNHHEFDEDNYVETELNKASNCYLADIENDAKIIMKPGKNTIQKCIRADKGLDFS